jgi:hypothetical protein
MKRRFIEAMGGGASAKSFIPKPVVFMQNPFAGASAGAGAGAGAKGNNVVYSTDETRAMDKFITKQIDSELKKHKKQVVKTGEKKKK